MELTQFFDRGQRIIALPNWDSPRVLICQDNIDSDQQKKIYPASTVLGILRRNILFYCARKGLLKSKYNTTNEHNCVNTFTNDYFLNAKPSAIVVGVGGAAQKYSIQLSNQYSEVVGYIKYAEKPLAKQRLLHEYKMLMELPEGVGPRPIGYQSIKDGNCLLLPYLPGKGLPVSFKYPKALKEFSQVLIRDENHQLLDHPWINNLLAEIGEHPQWLKDLSKRKWSECFLHGDFTPWNLLDEGCGKIKALDWENGDVKGFPFIDLIYYFLRIACIVKRIPASIARQRVVTILKQAEPDLDDLEIGALIRLTALYAYYRRKEEEPSRSDYILDWYNRILRPSL